MCKVKLSFRKEQKYVKVFSKTELPIVSGNLVASRQI